MLFLDNPIERNEKTPFIPCFDWYRLWLRFLSFGSGHGRSSASICCLDVAVLFCPVYCFVLDYFVVGACFYHCRCLGCQ